MGSPCIYYYPSRSGGLKTINLGTYGETNLSDIQEDPIGSGTYDRALSGRLYRQSYGTHHTIRIVRERFVSAALARELLTLDAHLRNGGVVGVAQNSDKAWAAFAAGLPIRGGQTRIITLGNNFYNTAATLSSGDEVTIHSDAPETNREINTISSVSGTSVNLAAGVTYDYTMTTIVRHRDFYPVLRLARSSLSRPIVTHDHRWVYTLDMQLEEDIGALFGMAPRAAEPLRGSTGSGKTIEDVINDGPGGKTIARRFRR